MSAMVDAFVEQLRVRPTDGDIEYLEREFERAKADSKRLEAKLESATFDAIRRQWFYYGWQACYRSKKP